MKIKNCNQLTGPMGLRNIDLMYFTKVLKLFQLAGKFILCLCKVLWWSLYVSIIFFYNSFLYSKIRIKVKKLILINAYEMISPNTIYSRTCSRCTALLRSLSNHFVLIKVDVPNKQSITKDNFKLLAAAFFNSCTF